jgi:hypothetical protein
MKYRKKPVTIDAVKWRGDNLASIVRELCDVGKAGTLTSRDGILSIKTLEGTMQATPGDWIIRGVKGELYACKPDIFEATYELVDSSIDRSQRRGR